MCHSSLKPYTHTHRLFTCSCLRLYYLALVICFSVRSTSQRRCRSETSSVFAPLLSLVVLTYGTTLGTPLCSTALLLCGLSFSITITCKLHAFYTPVNLKNHVPLYKALSVQDYVRPRRPHIITKADAFCMPPHGRISRDKYNLQSPLLLSILSRKRSSRCSAPAPLQEGLGRFSEFCRCVSPAPLGAGSAAPRRV